MEMLPEGILAGCLAPNAVEPILCDVKLLLFGWRSRF